MSIESPPDHTTPSDDAASLDHDASVTGAAQLRRSNEKVIAGVAGGIAQRFDINVTLVRAIFVVLTLFWGLGAAIYLVLWVAIRSAPLDANGLTRRSMPVSTSHRLSVAVAGALVALAALALAVLRPLRWLAPSLALAWIVFLAVLAIIAIKTPARRLTLRRFVAVIFLCGASAVIVVVGIFMGFLASTGVSLAGGSGNHLWQPTSLAQVARDYSTVFGVATVDVSGVRFPVAGQVLSASVGAGLLVIVVPADAVVSLTTNVGIGVVDDSPSQVHGVSTAAYSALPPGMTAARARLSAHLIIDARVGIGRIDLMRAQSIPS